MGQGGDMDQEQHEDLGTPSQSEQPDGSNPKQESTSVQAGAIKRRDLLKSLIGLPVVGALLWRALKKKGLDDEKRQEILAELGDLGQGPAVITEVGHGEKIRLGVIGFGGEGEWLTRCAGFVPQDRTEEWQEELKKDPEHTALRDFLAQTDLNLEITAVCDTFDVRAERALSASRNNLRPGGEGKVLQGAQRYRHYQDLLDSKEVDAVIIATPDHWHARMVIDAASAGIPVYVEKAMTRTEEEAHEVYRAVKESGIAFQLGHQNRQIEAYNKAREIAEKGIIGPINLVETTTNRNSPNGAWVYEIDERGTPQTIDWELFQETAPNKVPFSAERFFRWRCWWEYGTGLSGDLFSHEFDSVNQILQVGIPAKVSASGGVYFYDNDKFFNYHDREEFPVTELRTVPDVFNVACEYPERRMTLVYSATLSNSRHRGLVMMGHNGSMEVGNTLTVTADQDSTRFKSKIENQVINPSLPLFTFSPGQERIDAITSASDQYFLSRGLMYTYRGGQRFPTNHLHIAEWLGVIRNGGETSCNIERGFEEAMACHMATRSYLEGRQVTWDPVSRRIV